jgi:hypothetical protein
MIHIEYPTETRYTEQMSEAIVKIIYTFKQFCKYASYLRNFVKLKIERNDKIVHGENNKSQ